MRVFQKATPPQVVLGLVHHLHLHLDPQDDHAVLHDRERQRGLRNREKEEKEDDRQRPHHRGDGRPRPGGGEDGPEERHPAVQCQQTASSLHLNKWSPSLLQFTDCGQDIVG